MSILKSYSNDPKLKILYNRKINRTLTANNAVGPTVSTSLRTLGITLNDTNTFYVSSSGLDTNTGNQSSPFKTLQKAINSCIMGRGNICILDDEEYEVKAQTLPAAVTGIYSALGKMPNISGYISNTATFMQNDYTSTDNGSAVEVVYSDQWSRGNIIFQQRILDTTKDGASVVLMGHELISPSGGEKWNLAFIDANGEVLKINTIPYASITGCYLSTGEFAVMSKGSQLLLQIYGIDGTLKSTSSDLYAQTDVLSSVLDLVSVGSDVYMLAVKSSDGLRYLYRINGSGVVETTASSLWGRIFAMNNVLYLYATDNKIYTINPITLAQTFLKNSNAGLLANGNRVYCIHTGNIMWFGMSGNTFQYVICAPDLVFSSGSFSTAGMLPISTVVQMGPFNDYCYALCGWYTSEAIYGTTSAEIYVYSEKFERVNSHVAENWLHGTRKEVALIPSRDKYARLLIGDFSDYYTKIFHVRKYRYQHYYSIFKTSGPLIINGVSITPKYTYCCAQIINSAYNLTTKWAKFSNNRIPNTTAVSGLVAAIAVTADGVTIDVQNCIFSRCGAGVYNKKGSTILKWTQIYQTSRGYAVTVDGFLSDSYLLIDHCDISLNYGGVNLINTYAGADRIIIRNSILHKNIGHAISAAVAISFINSLYTGTINNVTPGAACIKTDPLYENEGVISADDTDFNLHRKYLGDYFDSIALELGTDGKNAGSLDTSLSGDLDTWDESLITKQYIDISVIPVSGFLNIRKNGSAAGRKDSSYEKLVLRFDGILNEDLESLLKIYMQTDNLTVRIYFEPVNDPYKYTEYTIDPTAEMKISPNRFRLSRTGGEGASMIFVRQLVEA